MYFNYDKSWIAILWTNETKVTARPFWEYRDLFKIHENSIICRKIMNKQIKSIYSIWICEKNLCPQKRKPASTEMYLKHAIVICWERWYATGSVGWGSRRGKRRGAGHSDVGTMMKHDHRTKIPRSGAWQFVQPFFFQIPFLGSNYWTLPIERFAVVFVANTQLILIDWTTWSFIEYYWVRNVLNIRDIKITPNSVLVSNSDVMPNVLGSITGWRRYSFKER